MAPIALARALEIRCDEARFGTSTAAFTVRLVWSSFTGALIEKKTSAFGYARVFDLLDPSARYYHHDRSWAARPGHRRKDREL